MALNDNTHSSLNGGGQTTINGERIKEKAKSIYDIVISNSTTAKSRFYKQLSCNYKLLEEKCEEYKLKYLT